MASEKSKADPEVRFERGIPLNHRFTGEIFDPPEPLLPELAAAAAPKKVTPTAGSYAIERFVLPDDIEIPPESMTNEGEFFPFNLDEDKMPPFILDRRDVLKHIPKELLESEGDKPYVFTPVQKDDKVKPEPSGNFNQMMDTDVTKRLADVKIIAAANAAVAEVRQLQEEQEKFKAAVAPKTPNKAGSIVEQRSRSRSKSKGKPTTPAPKSATQSFRK